MIKTICLLLLISWFKPMIGQLDYFNNIYGDGILTNIISLDNDIYTFGAVNGNSEMLVHKLNSEGQAIWSTMQYIGGLFYPEAGSSLNLTKNGLNFTHGTEIYSDNMGKGSVISYDLDFNINWTYLTENINPDTIEIEFQVAKELADGIYAAGNVIYDYSEGAGQTFSNLLVTKLDLEGNLIWENEYNWSEITGGEHFLRVSQIHELPNDEILICVSRYHNWNQILLKMDTDGNILDWYEWGGGLNDWLSFAVVDEDGTAMVAYRETYDFFNDDPIFTISQLHLMKFDYNLMEPIWDITYPSSMRLCYLFDLIRTSDGGYMMGGHVLTDEDDEITPTYQTAYILKTDSLGEFEWYKQYIHEDETPEEPEAYGTHEMYDMDNTSDGGVVACGRYFDYSEPAPETWVFKIDVCGDIQDLGCPIYTHVIDQTEIQNPKLQIYPNPSNGISTIEFPLAAISHNYSLRIYHQNGQLIELKQGSQLRSKMEIDVSGWSAGLYLVQAVDVDGKVMDARKLVVE